MATADNNTTIIIDKLIFYLNKTKLPTTKASCTFVLLQNNASKRDERKKGRRPIESHLQSEKQKETTISFIISTETMTSA